MTAERGGNPADDEGQPSGEPGPSNPDESVPSEQDAKEDLPGIPDEQQGGSDPA